MYSKTLIEFFKKYHFTSAYGTKIGPKLKRCKVINHCLHHSGSHNHPIALLKARFSNILRFVYVAIT